MNYSQNNTSFGLSLNQIIWIVRRQKIAIAVCIFLGLLTANLFITLVPPKYAASSQLLFDAAAEQFVSPDPELRTVWAGPHIFGSAVAMIESPGILKSVALKLMSQSAQRAPSETVIQKILANPTLSDDERLATLIDRLQKDLTVKTQAADQVIILEYRSQNPNEAAFLANLIAATFLEERDASRKASLAQATEWLNQRSAEAKDRLIAADKKMQDFAASHIDKETGSTSLEPELTRKREQLSAVETRLAEAQSVYNTLKSYTNANAKDSDRLDESVGGTTLERLRASLADALGAQASAKAKLGAFHPDVQARESQIAQIRAEITAESRRRQLTSKIDIDQLTARQQTLRDEIKTLEVKVRDFRVSDLQLVQLGQEREAVRTLYDSMLTKLMQANLQRTLNFPQFKILLSAIVPKNPKLPPALIWAGGLIGGLGFGIIAAILWELLQGRLVMLDQARKQLPIKTITQLPSINNKDFNGAAPEIRADYRNFARNYPRSLFANKLVPVQIAVSAIDNGENCKIVMITSPTQGNGKSLICSNLASLSTMLGSKNLLIDLDARKFTPDADSADGPESSELLPFLREYQLEDVFTPARRTKTGGYDVLRVRASNEAGSLRFFQTQTTQLLKFARENYDYVWVDTPPVLIFNDPLIIAKQVDGAVIVAEWSKTTMNEVKDTIGLFLESGGHVLGVVLNKVKVDRLISEPMAYYANYYRKKEHDDVFPEI